MSKELIEHHRSQDKIEVIADEIPARISWNSISEQVMSVLNIERGIFYTLIELLFRPGKAVRIHLFKDRKRMVNPIRFLVFSTTLATVITFYYINNQGFNDAFQEGFVLNSESDASEETKQQVMNILVPRIVELMKQFVNLSYFFLVPTSAILAWFLMRKKYNVPELAVANCFMWSMLNCITILFTPLMGVDSLAPISAGLILLFSIAYPTYFYIRFFNEGWKGVAKTFILNAGNLVLICIFFIFLVVYHFWDIESLVRPHTKSF